MSYEHVPVMMREVLEALQPRAGGRYVDGTIGGGGHAAMILEASEPGSWLGGCDRDGAAVEAASSRLAPYNERVEIRRGTAAELGEWIDPKSVDGVLLDLGASMPQMTVADRGFSLKADGPLDMRMDHRGEWTAADLVNEKSESDLAKIFWELGGERASRKIAQVIVKQRIQQKFERTMQLASAVESVKPRRGRRTHPATKVFQALRMEVNGELGQIRNALPVAASLLKPGGRLAVITFHSGEDRLVKSFGRVETRDYDVPGEVDVPELRVARPQRMRWVQRKAIKPDAVEVANNPASRSAQLRVLERVGMEEGE